MLYDRLDCLSLKFLPQEHKILRELRPHVLGRTLLVAVSGGVDSMLLLAVMRRLQPVLGVKLYAAHIHHGPTNKKQLLYRNRARQGVKVFCKQLDVPFYTNVNKPKKILKSEDELRQFRYREIERVRLKIKNVLKEDALPLLLLAHHQDDLLETQMMRLVRGTGTKGLEAMTLNWEGKLRPFLNLSRNEIEGMAKKLRLKWLEDPSNQDEDPLRNWMRYVWLPKLEEKIPGARSSLARSLALIAKSADKKSDISGVIQKNCILRKKYLALSRDERQALIAQYLHALKVRNFTTGHIEEIYRRLDNRRGEYTFSLLKHDWSVNALHIRAILS